MTTRRDFLKTITAASAVLPLPLAAITSTDNTPLSNDRVLRVAFCGLGSYARRCADAIKDCKRVKIMGAISGTPAKLEEWQTKYGVPKDACYSYDTMDAIKNNPNIDAVYICTPNALHHPQTLRVAKAGKHVICEKPMSVSVKHAEEMIAACKAANVQLLIGYRMHFEPKTLEIIRMRKEGELGKILFFQGLCGFRIGDPTQWRLKKDLAGGGAMMDIGIYAINGARYMIGEEPIWISAQEVKTDPVKFKEGVDETIQFQMGFPSGAVASCLSTYSMNGLDKFYLNGEKGFAEMQPSTGYGPIKARTNKGELTHPHVTHQAVQLDEMAAILFDGKQPIVPIDGAEGLKDMKIIEAIFKSAAKNGKKIVVKI
jgi:predicted dehydrogenase